MTDRPKTCGTCHGSGNVPGSIAIGMLLLNVPTSITTETCGTCGGSGRISR